MRLALNDIAINRSGTTIVEHISASVNAGECLCLTGASGCGKTTILQAIAELIPLEDGSISRRYRRLGYLFQQPRLLPWRSAAENITLIPNTDLERAAELFHALDLSPADQRKYPAELSGGMQQRVALVRALVGEPDLLLMDEPFSALDHRLRRRLQNHIIARIEAGLSVILVSHDREEALRLAHHIIHLAKPAANEPANIRHALTLGTPPSQRDSDYIQAHLNHPALQGIDDS